MSYTPTNWKTGDKVTAEKLNNIEDGIVNNALPSVTPEDDGKVLGVENGAWTVTNSVQPSGGGGAFVVHLDATTGTLDKTWQEIYNAMQTGIVVVVSGIETPTAAELYSFPINGAGYSDSNYSLGANAMGATIAFATTTPDGYPVQTDG